LNILITGSSGQVGTNLALALQSKGVTVLGIDKRRNTWTDQIPFIQRDLAKEGMPSLAEMAAAGVGQPPLVGEVGAHAKGDEFVVNPSRAHENTTITFNVLEFCRLQQTPIIFSSSREVYGKPHPPCVGEDTTDVFHILSPYAAYKLADEMLIYSYANCYGLKYLVFRLSNVYGRFDSDLERMTRVVHIFIDRLSRGEPITIFDRSKVIDFTYVDDCVNAFLLGIQKLVNGELYNHTINVSSGSPASLLHLAQTIAKIWASPRRLSTNPSSRGKLISTLPI
jgi:UDP-glucose 4-epimerase